MTGRQTCLADVIEARSPMPARRAASLMVAVARELLRLESQGRRPGLVGADRVVLEDDGTVHIVGVPDATRRADPAHPADPESGASVGRLWFELMVGRPPLDPSEGFEPVLTSSLSPQQCSMISCSCSTAPGQWPALADWYRELEAVAGGLAPPLPPRQRAAARRRAVLAAVALVVLVLLTAAVLVLAPRWWDAATTDEGLGRVAAAAAAQAPRASS